MPVLEPAPPAAARAHELRARGRISPQREDSGGGGGGGDDDAHPVDLLGGALGDAHASVVEPVVATVAAHHEDVLLPLALAQAVALRELLGERDVLGVHQHAVGVILIDLGRQRLEHLPARTR